VRIVGFELEVKAHQLDCKPPTASPARPSLQPRSAAVRPHSC